ncbi:unnamed protein product, partial [Chrysoparadoxa australica]
GELRTAPPQSELVKKTFGAKRGRGGHTGSRNTSNARQAQPPPPSSPGEAERERMAVLEAEIERYRALNEKGKRLRRQQETAVQEVMKKRQEVRAWAEAEKA